MSRFVWRISDPTTLDDPQLLKAANDAVVAGTTPQRGPEAVFHDRAQALTDQFATALSAAAPGVGTPREYFQAWVKVTDHTRIRHNLATRGVVGNEVFVEPLSVVGIPLSSFPAGFGSLTERALLRFAPGLLQGFRANAFPFGSAKAPPPPPSAPATFCGEGNPKHPDRRLFVPRQRYLRGVGSDARGLDITAAWTYVGGLGEGIQVVDLERGQLEHECLNPAVARLREGKQEEGHGTSVESLLAGRPVSAGPNLGPAGMLGVAPEAKVFFTSAYDQDQFLDHAWAIIDAIDRGALRKGDVLLSEVLIRLDGQALAKPMESYADGWLASWLAVEHGIHVVHAAGNDGALLETDPTGAIMVGASLPDGHSVTTFASGHGQRVDLHAWGDCVISAGSKADKSLQDRPLDSECYTFFGGTSAAAALVAGAVACLSGILQANGIPPGPDIVRTVRDCLVQGGTQPPTGGAQGIGPMLNVAGAIRELQGSFPGQPFQRNARFGLTPEEVALTVVRKYVP